MLAGRQKTPEMNAGFGMVCWLIVVLTAMSSRLGASSRNGIACSEQLNYHTVSGA